MAPACAVAVAEACCNICSVASSERQHVLPRAPPMYSPYHASKSIMLCCICHETQSTPCRVKPAAGGETHSPAIMRSVAGYTPSPSGMQPPPQRSDSPTGPRHSVSQWLDSRQPRSRPPAGWQQADYRTAGSSSSSLAAPRREAAPRYEAAIPSAKVRRAISEQQRQQKYGGGAATAPRQPQQWQLPGVAHQPRWAPAQQPAQARAQLQFAEPQQQQQQQQVQQDDMLEERRSSSAGASSSGSSQINGVAFLLRLSVK